MKFTEDFKARCKKVYPDWKRLHEKLEEGSDWVGRYLDDSRESGIDYDEILAATSLDELQAAALLIKEQNDLYHDFVDGKCWEGNKIVNELIINATARCEESVCKGDEFEPIME